MCGMTNTTGRGEGKPMDLYSGDEWFTQELVKIRNERDCWLETARQESNGREYYRSLVAKIGEMFGAAAMTCDDGTVVDDVLCAKVPELVSAALRREAVLREALKEAHKVILWAATQFGSEDARELAEVCEEHRVKIAQTLDLSACDEVGK